MNKRQYQRVEVANAVADVSDGIGFFSGVVVDVSRTGIRLEDIPQRFNDHATELSIVVSVKDKYFKLQGAPRWSNGNAISKKMGVKILISPPGWKAFVKTFETREEDIRAVVTR